MANRRSTPSRPSSLPETTRVTGTGRDVVVEILDDSDTPLDETGQETGTAKLPVAKQVHTQIVSSAPNLLNQDQALQDELADIDADFATYEADLASYRAKTTHYEAMSAKIDAEWAELEAKCDDIEVRRRKLEADSAEYEAMRAAFDTKSDRHNARAEELAAMRADLKMRHMSYTRRREIARQSQSRINLSKNADRGIRPFSRIRASAEIPAQPSFSSKQGTFELQQIRAEVREVIATPGEALQQLGFEPISFAREAMATQSGVNEDASAPNVDADGYSSMSLGPASTSAEPKGPKKFNMPFQEESPSPPRSVPNTAKLAKRRPAKSRRLTEKECAYQRMDPVYKKPWKEDD